VFNHEKESDSLSQAARTIHTLAAVAALLAWASAARASGPVVAWGYDNSSQATPPASVDGTAGTATAIAAGGHSCAIQAGSGAVVCWGFANYGDLDITPPASVDGTAGTAIAIAVSTASCAIQARTNAVVCWGYNNAFEATPPASVNGTAGTASAIATGDGYFLAIRRVPEPAALGLGRVAIGTIAGLRSRRRTTTR